MEAFGFMLHLAQSFAPETVSWLKPTLLQQSDANAVLLPYWLGAWFIQIVPPAVPLDIAARIPFMGLLALTLGATWYGVYALARSPAAQPVAFAFGGEARPADYGRALADGSLLALLACLGLARLSHEATPALAQLAFSALLFVAGQLDAQTTACFDQRWSSYFWTGIVWCTCACTDFGSGWRFDHGTGCQQAVSIARQAC